ncbi:amino acid ABC transporter permease [Chelatococcus asaccharovorans]|uniref:Polar amino acid transport system permease protein n=1 Tax=Chelatococcus asaccharovorans TaxID=28210 RepID=A0A2V3UHZ3_9HYPH|nr:amino acid ABC transporter permease [Chelatococcus asaccharovorans]MBS7701864.1 amino acid ABC transporter permease [Chelatococcus asaccharovorans]PXW64427.1 polar amino acid transport system permease protein [Chelatococcus asaccharovorans]
MDFDLHVIENGIPLLMKGLITTIWVCGASLGIGTVLGSVACLSKLYGNRQQRLLANAYVNLFRTVPELVVIFWVYSCLPLFLNVRLSAPICGLVAMSLYAGAYLAEIFRAGILAVPRGQTEAGLALGIPTLHIWTAIIIPPALRRMAPALMGFLTELIKVSALLSTIAVGDLFYEASLIAAETFRYVEMISVVAVIYFIMIFPLSMIARYKERRLRAEIGH